MSKMPSLIKNSLERLNRIGSTDKKGPLLYSMHHFDEKTGRTRQKRADRRSNIKQILTIMIPEMDLDTLAWGQFFTRHDGVTDLYTRGIEYLSKQSGMNHKTICRVLSDLESHGYMQVKRSEGMGKDGNEIRHYSLRKFTSKFFIELGFKNKTIEDTRAWKRKKNEIKYYSKKCTDKCSKGLGKINAIFKKHAVKKDKISKSIPKSSQSIKPRDTSNLLHKASEIASRQGRSPMDVYRELVAAI